MKGSVLTQGCATTSEWEATRSVLIALASHWAFIPEGRPVLTQLCSAIAALAAKMEAWPTADVVKVEFLLIIHLLSRDALD